MEKLSSQYIELLCKDLFDEGQSHTLLYGKPELTLAILKGVYQRAKEKPGLLCSFHNASKINQPMDFFEPILKLKYEDEYESLKQKQWFKNLLKKRDGREIFRLSGLCAMEEKSNNSNQRKLPVIFIDGIEELLFKMDYSHLKDKERKNFNLEQPIPRGFGNCLRGDLHQTNRGIFYGTVRDIKKIDYLATLGNYNYLFYEGNFRQIDVVEK